MLKKLISNKIFWVFILIHCLFFNINFAEWGDTYRILRASEYIRDFKYPGDEKRQPLFSLALAIRPENVDQILWGRLEMLLFSVASFVVFYKLLHQFEFTRKEKDLALWLFVFNPIFLYWTLRVYADVPFTLIVLFTFYLYKKWQQKLNAFRLVLLGIIVGFSILTRFEGFLLAGALGLGILLENTPEKFVERLKNALIFGFSSIIIFLPWSIYRNPLGSKYLSEPSGRAYDMTMVLIFFSSLLFIFGLTSGFYFFFKNKKKIHEFFIQNKAFSIFIILELILSLLWPAAIPRLFVPIIPLLIIPLAIFINDYLDSKYALGVIDLLGLFALLGVYIASQFFFRLQFLILSKYLFLVNVCFQIVQIFSIYFRKEKLFKIALILSLILWSTASILLHKDIYKTLVTAGSYTAENFSGCIAYNDVSSVTDWYLNQKNKDDDVVGIYLNMDSKEGRAQPVLIENNVDYIMITNEHNPTLEFDANEVAYLEEIKEFRYTINGTEFFTKVVKVLK